jgi:hypothetical protein
MVLVDFNMSTCSLLNNKDTNKWLSSLIYKTIRSEVFAFMEIYV